MSSPFGLTNDELSPDELERLIRAAGTYVVPSSDLRARTIEDVREYQRGWIRVRRLMWLVISVAIIWGASYLISNKIANYRTHVVAPFTEEMNQTAAELAEQNRYGVDWGLVDAYERQRLGTNSKSLADKEITLPSN